MPDGRTDMVTVFRLLTHRALSGPTLSVGDKIGAVGHSGSATDFYLGLDAVSNEEMLDISQLLAE